MKKITKISRYKIKDFLLGVFKFFKSCIGIDNDLSYIIPLLELYNLKINNIVISNINLETIYRDIIKFTIDDISKDKKYVYDFR